MKSVEDLKAWQVAMQLVEKIYVLSRKFPKEETYGLTSQLRRAATSIATNIAEGFGRYTYPDKANKYIIARGECGEVTQRGGRAPAPADPERRGCPSTRFARSGHPSPSDAAAERPRFSRRVKTPLKIVVRLNIVTLAETKTCMDLTEEVSKLLSGLITTCRNGGTRS